MQGLGAGETTSTAEACQAGPPEPGSKTFLSSSLSSTFYRQSLMSCQLAKPKYLKGPDAHLGANKKVEFGDERQ